MGGPIPAFRRTVYLPFAVAALFPGQIRHAFHTYRVVAADR